jgi:hypothetical protein
VGELEGVVEGGECARDLLWGGVGPERDADSACDGFGGEVGGAQGGVVGVGVLAGAARADGDPSAVEEPREEQAIDA